MASRKRSKPAEPPTPDALVREVAGRYRSGDGRFAVQQSDAAWFLVDTEQQNELGQELMHGPYPTLQAVRDAIPGARAVTLLPRRRAAGRSRAERPAPPPPPPPSWIDELPSADAVEVRRIIRALEREGVEDAESVVRRDRELDQPIVVAHLIERRLDAIVDELPLEERAEARALVSRAAEVLSTGESPGRSLAGWALVELVSATETANRRVRLRGAR